MYIDRVNYRVTQPFPNMKGWFTHVHPGPVCSVQKSSRCSQRIIKMLNAKGDFNGAILVLRSQDPSFFQQGLVQGWRGSNARGIHVQSSFDFLDMGTFFFTKGQKIYVYIYMYVA